MAGMTRQMNFSSPAGLTLLPAINLLTLLFSRLPYNWDVHVRTNLMVLATSA